MRSRFPSHPNRFDFVYCINVMHHIEDRNDQSQAFDEIARILKPRGYFFLHEINVTNPLPNLHGLHFSVDQNH